ncbi:ABC transporter permease subunit [Falsirhodobacter xinxiangensis]|uniref:ABC transporter permease subunit n=1 Tax=Falsirhodobacter xinxiangensis TaxID=2530049 RepID=UPI001C705691|nr:ABC transporter permease subunit [Rhodobacter xinxiangensis]
MDISRLLDVFFNLSVAVDYFPTLLRGAWITVLLAFVVVVSGLAAGLARALIRLASPRWIVEILRLWVGCIRALPPLALLLLRYFGLPSLGANLSATWVLGLVPTAILAAFAEDIFGAGITAIPKGPAEASRSTGMTQAQTLHYVILPQAIDQPRDRDHQKHRSRGPPSACPNC